ncbi:S8 family serine peptidase [Polaribacter sp. Hel1_85]|uniref:S8 family serine peptidase n=1 Tax=Polaribacter sp. Hel1_85 TaxID=1250005 RepID=UPI00052C6F05|nr:S8 family serine peptidase [Polaribacter sp. Hel1_85]KGL59010.1 peptidase S8 and S53, subtilisin, kexin, sedolisin [Polaribacter sp. Hel1_85]
MKKNNILVLAFFLSLELFSQNEKDREIIISHTNVEKLNQISKEFLEIQNQFKDKKVEQIISTNKGVKNYFSHFDKSGSPVYYSLENESSAESSKVDLIRTGGSSGLNLNGSGIEFGLWDLGSPRITHQEFNNNITVVDNTTIASHATHIAGILIASGVVSESKGMAPSATIKSYDTTNWISEVPAWAAAGGLISSHSYIIANPGTNYEKYGIYNQYSQWWDDISYNAPYLIMCTGASNNGNKGYNPGGSRYDLLASNKLGKNSIVVGASSDVLNYTGPESVEQAYFTSWGPTDDWRIKPDITAVGVSSYSTREANDSNYSSGNGCSFAAPIVSGGLALLQQHYYDSNSVYMKATTAKALILSTTDEAGEYDGPDFSNGWGLFNAFKAAEVITNNGASAIISELTLNQDDTYSVKINVDGTQPLSVAICWNDPAAEPLKDELYNDATPMLINDLDVRVVSDTETYYPWMMQPNNDHNNYTDEASKGDNYRDNVEIINVKNINAGQYTVNVSHKGTLKDGLQDFSLVINGVKLESLSISEFDNEKENIFIFPNPVNDVLKIKFDSSKFQDIKISIYNVLGKKQIEAKSYNQNTMELDVSSFSKGVYILKIHDDKGNVVSSKKILIN